MRFAFVPPVLLARQMFPLQATYSVSPFLLFVMVTHFDTTLGMGGWLDLTQQGLSPCKKYKTSWRSYAESYRIIGLVQLSF